MHSGTFRTRKLGVFLFFLVFLSAILLRLFYLQAFRHNFFSKIASDQHVVSIELEPKRGSIFDRNMRVLALNMGTDSIFVNPREAKDKKKTTRLLARALSLNESFVYERLSRDKSFVWLKRKVPNNEAAAVKALKLNGVGALKESKRFYPNKSLACHVIGLSNIDNVGLEGLELNFDSYLKGESGWLTATQDARRKLLESYEYEFIPPKNGFSLVLTIDQIIQHIAERELLKACEKHHAKAGSIVVMDPRTGDIMALANFPDFDLNNPSGRPQEAIRNRAVNDFFEPGSVFKIVTASAALDEKAVKFADKFYCENGEYKVGRRILHDHRPHGTLTFKEVIEVSSNIGTIKVAAVFGPAKMYKYMKDFGLYEKTGIDLPGEVVGINRPLSRWSGVSMYAIPMGQEVTITAIQLVSMIAVIADNGFLVKPRIIKEIIDDNGYAIKEFPPKVRHKAISPETAARMRWLLKGVVENGTGKKAKVKEFTTGGKTGTAQKVEGGTYSHDKFVASFIGFAPAEKPIMAIVVCIDEPHPVYYGGDVAAPVFRNVVEESLKYLSVKGEN